LNFPEKALLELGKDLAENELALSVLRALTVNHFHLFNEKFDTKQRVCENLGIRYRPFQAGGSTKMLPRGRS
jgi:hypothetical protein